MNGAPLLRIRLFGGLAALTSSDVQLQFTNRKVAQLAAFLAVRLETGAERLQAALAVWPDSEPEAALASLRNALVALRRDVEGAGLSPEGVLTATRTRVGLVPEAVSCDVSEFETLVRGEDADVEHALSLYAGPLAPEIEAVWAETERHRLSLAYEAAVSRRVGTLVGGGCADKAASEALRAAVACPESEVVCQTAMSTLIAAGRASEAVKTYRRFERHLRCHLGVAPGQQTVDLARTARRMAAPAHELPACTLPTFLPRLFGRCQEVVDLRTALSPGERTVRLVTMVGTGGVGKTRLALEAAQGLAPAYGGAVWFADLSSVTDPDDLISATLASVGRESERFPDLESFSGLIGDRDGLIVLDNLEQFGPGLATPVEALLTACPGLKVLATSRQAIGFPGEVVVSLSPLPVPQEGSEALESASVRLFIDRARQVAPSFTPQDPVVLARLVARLEGLPLAICLAAAQADVSTAEETLRGLDDLFSILQVEDVDWPERHRRLWACIDWSYRLYPEAHGLLKRVAVFRGGWTRAAVAWACPDTSVAPLLQGLLRSSLIFEQSRGGTVRFDMFESVREFLVSQMSREELESARERHAHAMRQWMAESRQRNQPFNAGYIADRLADYENFRQAMAWFLANEPRGALEIANGLAYFWYSREMLNEGIDWIRRILQVLEHRPDTELAMAYRALATLYNGRTQFDEAMDCLDVGLRLLPDDAPPVQRARYLNTLGNALMRIHRFDQAIASFEEAEALCGAAGEPVTGVSMLGNRGFAHYLAGDLDNAEALTRRAIGALEPGDNDDWAAHFHHHLGLILLAKDDVTGAEAEFAEARRLVQASGVDPAVRSWFNDAALAAMKVGNLGQALEWLQRSAAAIATVKGPEHHAECIDVAADFAAAVGDKQEAVALLSVLERIQVEPQRSRAVPYVTPGARLSALREALGAEAYRNARARYANLSVPEVLAEIADYDSSSGASERKTGS